jgi:hypothetical protein
MSTSLKRTQHQQDCSHSYSGSYITHASHYISAAERDYFNLPNSNDGPANYRNQNALTNQSVHTTIDNFFLQQSPKHSFQCQSLTSNAGLYIPEREIAARVQQKIDVAKQTGDIYNSQFRSYLYKSAESTGLDLRQFNGYS